MVTSIQLMTVQVILTTELDLKYLSAEIISSLKLSGDIQLNPAPYEIIGSVQGSFSQGNVTVFGETADRHCAYNALFSICWSVARDICYWRSASLD